MKRFVPKMVVVDERLIRKLIHCATLSDQEHSDHIKEFYRTSFEEDMKGKSTEFPSTQLYKAHLYVESICLRYGINPSTALPITAREVIDIGLPAKLLESSPLERSARSTTTPEPT